MKQPELIIRTMQSEEYPLLREFLYQAIFLPEGAVPPSRSVIDLPELQVYISDFGTQFGDHCLVAEVNGKIAGAAWSRMMEDYGHIDEDTPSLAISLLPEYRGQGIGTKLLNNLLALLYKKRFSQVSLSVQKKNPAFRLYKRAGFSILEEKGTEYLMLLKYPCLKIRLAQAQDIDAWMELVECVKDKLWGWKLRKLGRTQNNGFAFYGKRICHLRGESKSYCRYPLIFQRRWRAMLFSCRSCAQAAAHCAAGDIIYADTDGRSQGHHSFHLSWRRSKRYCRTSLVQKLRFFSRKTD